MSIELQQLDCNCSDCGFLERSLANRQRHVDTHYDWQKHHFNELRLRKIEKAEEWIRKEQKDKAKVLLNEARKMEFVYDEGRCSLGFGKCTKFNKQVSFVPNTLQLDTQECFVHRKLLK